MLLILVRADVCFTATCYNGGEVRYRMSHSISVPDDVYAELSQLAADQGRNVEAVAAALLKRGLQSDVATQPPLDWDAASAEEIITDLYTSRVERERPTEL